MWNIRLRIALDFYRCSQNNNAIDHAVTSTLLRFHDMYQGFRMFTLILCFKSFLRFANVFATFYVKFIPLYLQRHFRRVKRQFHMILA